MNLILYMLNTDAVKDIFKTIDWYKDLKRNIIMNKDGREENGFCFYEYFWQKEDKTLRIEFEKSGRGLNLIETEDYYT